MWTHVTLSVQIVWQDAIWSAAACWQDGPQDERIWLHKSGRVPLGTDTGPDAALLAAARALQGQALEHSDL